METPIDLKVSNENLTRGFREASDEINRITREEIVPAAGIIDDAFASAAHNIQRALTRAALTGELSLKSLARTIARDLGRVAIDNLVRRPIENLITGAFGGARANGGFVAAGQSFLVGERGPELFTPSVSGQVMASGGFRPGGGGMTVNISLPGVRDVDGFRQSQTQISASLARIIGRGQRNL